MRVIYVVVFFVAIGGVVKVVLHVVVFLVYDYNFSGI